MAETGETPNIYYGAGVSPFEWFNEEIVFLEWRSPVKYFGVWEDRVGADREMVPKYGGNI